VPILIISVPSIQLVLETQLLFTISVLNTRLLLQTWPVFILLC